MQPLQWTFLHPAMTADQLGLIPMFVSEDDPRPAREQFNERYISGWSPFQGHKMLERGVLKYPGDPPLAPLAYAKLRQETILFYDSAWVAIVQPDGSYEVCRMD